MRYWIYNDIDNNIDDNNSNGYDYDGNSSSNSSSGNKSLWNIPLHRIFLRNDGHVTQPVGVRMAGWQHGNGRVGRR